MHTRQRAHCASPMDRMKCISPRCPNRCCAHERGSPARVARSAARGLSANARGGLSRPAAGADVLAKLAKLDVAAVGLADYGKPGNYFARQVTRWSEQYRAAETERIEPMESLLDRLPQAVPADNGRVALVHGDFRIDNLIWSEDATSIAAVVDWELSTLGHPFSDIAYFCMALRLPRNPVLPGLAGIDRAALGIPDENALIARFAAATDLDPRPHWNFLLAFQFFRLAAIAQ